MVRVRVPGHPTRAPGGARRVSEKALLIEIQLTSNVRQALAQVLVFGTLYRCARSPPLHTFAFISFNILSCFCWGRLFCARHGICDSWFAFDTATHNNNIIIFIIIIIITTTTSSPPPSADTPHPPILPYASSSRPSCSHSPEALAVPLFRLSHLLISTRSCEPCTLFCAFFSVSF